jgi:hypothetical protein
VSTRKRIIRDQVSANQQEKRRIAAIGQEYCVRLDDHAPKYALPVSAKWVPILELIMPVNWLTVPNG